MIGLKPTAYCVDVVPIMASKLFTPTAAQAIWPLWSTLFATLFARRDLFLHTFCTDWQGVPEPHARAKLSFRMDRLNSGRPSRSCHVGKNIAQGLHQTVIALSRRACCEVANQVLVPQDALEMPTIDLVHSCSFLLPYPCKLFSCLINDRHRRLLLHVAWHYFLPRCPGR